MENGGLQYLSPLDKPVELMKNLAPRLKPESILVIVESDPQEHADAGSHSTQKEELQDQTVQGGFELIKKKTFLPRDTMSFLRVRGS